MGRRHGRGRHRGGGTHTGHGTGRSRNLGARAEGNSPDSTRGVLLYRGRRPTESEISSKGLSEYGADLIVADESNMFSSMTNRERRFLTVVCTRIPMECRKQYGLIAKQTSPKKGERAKYSLTRGPELSSIIRSISAMDIVIVESHRRIDYDRMSDPVEKGLLYIKVLGEALDKALDLCPRREVDVIIDSVPFKVDQDLRRLGMELSQSGMRIRWFETRRSATDRYLIVHDFETGAVAGWIEGETRGTILFEEHLRMRYKGS